MLGSITSFCRYVTGFNQTSSFFLLVLLLDLLSNAPFNPHLAKEQTRSCTSAASCYLLTQNLLPDRNIWLSK